MTSLPRPTDLHAAVRRMFRVSPQPAPMRRASDCAVVALPTQQDIDAPTTTEARAMVAIAAHAMAAIIERRTGVPTSAADAYDDARAVLSAALVTYRRIAERGE